MNPVTLSIVVIGRNEAERIGKCLESIQNEITTFPSAELIFVDAGSTDDSVAIAARLGIKALEIDPANAASARNAGLARCTGKYVQFLDGDMILSPGWLQFALERLEVCEFDAVAGKIVEETKNASIYSRVFGLDWNHKSGPVETLGGASLWRRQVIQRLGGFDEALDVGEDPDLSLRARALGHQLMQLDVTMVGHSLGLRTLGDWVCRGKSVGRSTALVFKRHSQARGARRRIFAAFAAPFAGIFIVVAFILWQNTIVIALPLLVTVMMVRRYFRHRNLITTRYALAHFIHVHLIKIPFMIGALPVLLSQKKETI